MGGLSDFMETIFALPTVIFTTLLLFSIGYWVIALAFGLGESGMDSGIEVDGPDIDVEVEVDVDADIDSAGASSGMFVGILQMFDLHLMPLTIVFTLISLTAWFVSVLATTLLTTDNDPGTLLTIMIAIGSFMAGVFVAGRVGRLLRPVFVPTRHIRRRDLIGRVCTVRTGRVDSSFGQAEVIDGEHSTHVIQIRCDTTNSLTTGHRALIVDVDDDGRFVVSPDVDSLI